jgi:tetratricopeptide (TPR) repeat protein
MQLREYYDGLDLLGKVRQQAITEEEEEILKETYVEEIRYRVGEEDYAQALTLADEYLKVSEDDEVNARIVFEMGKLYEKIDDIESALSSANKLDNPKLVTQIMNTLIFAQKASLTDEQ